MVSPAWRALGINSRRLLDFLMVEHGNHAGRHNGRLCATHKQLRDFGLTADSIRKAIDECVELGLLEHERGGRWGGTNRPSRFRLTFYADAEGSPPTNGWKRVTDQHVQRMRERRDCRRIPVQKQKAAPDVRPTVVPSSGVPDPADDPII
jgi:hypothetical protein